MNTNRWMWLALTACAAACDAVEADADAVVTARDDVDNGAALNSARLNGWKLNGMRLNGQTLNGMRLNGWKLNGWKLNGVSLKGSRFSALEEIDGEYVPVSGTQLIGSRLTLEGDAGGYTLRIDDIYPNPADPGGDVYFYAISVYDPASNLWSSLCTDHEGQPTQAIPIANSWDPDTGARLDDPDVVTFACRDAVLAKCVEWGYRPWATAAQCDSGGCEDVSLADYHQACTRLARADYCGDGTPHTLTGTPIDVFDALTPAIQSPATQARVNWGIEAEWGPDGALCVGSQLRLTMYDDLEIAYNFPPCLDALDDLPTCGDFDEDRGALLANRYCDQWLGSPAACQQELP